MFHARGAATANDPEEFSSMAQYNKYINHLPFDMLIKWDSDALFCTYLRCQSPKKTLFYTNKIPTLTTQYQPQLCQSYKPKLAPWERKVTAVDRKWSSFRRAVSSLTILANVPATITTVHVFAICLPVLHNAERLPFY